MLPLAGQTSEGSMGGGFESWKFPSYGQFNEMDHEPDSGDVNTVIKESQMEGFFMMLGFSLFAIIPSLLWLVLPLLVVSEPTLATTTTAAAATTTTLATTHVKLAKDMAAANQSAGGQIISLSSLIVSISGILMWFLGVWKSRFMNSNWIMSGMENVVVLLACVISAYGVGFSLCYVIGGKEGITISNVVY